MAFLKNLFGKSKDEKIELTDDDVQQIFEEYISDRKELMVNNPLLFRQSMILDNGKKLYTAMLNVCIGDKRIPNNYHVLMCGLDVCLVKQESIKGKPILRLPPYFESGMEYISFYDLSKYELQTTFIDYKGFYKPDTNN